MIRRFSEDILQREQLENDRVIVRIWTSAFNLRDEGETVGHVSIEIPEEGIYLSFWPEYQQTPSGELVKVGGDGVQDRANLAPKRSYEEDEAAEDRPPELTFYFYTLDVPAMVAEYQRLSQTQWWSVGGMLIFENSESCASSSWKLLEAGGITGLISRLKQYSIASRGSSWGSCLSSFWSARDSDRSKKASSYSMEMSISPLVKSPDFIGECLKKAKLSELKETPATREIQYPGETPMETATRRNEKSYSSYNTIAYMALFVVIGSGVRVVLRSLSSNESSATVRSVTTPRV